MNRLVPGCVAGLVLLTLWPAAGSADTSASASNLRKLLKDPAPAVRLGAAKALAEANDPDAFPVLIALLADLSAEQRRPVEELLIHLAGEWAPVGHLASEDRIARRVHRDAWAAWWKNTDGEAVLAVANEHTLTPPKRKQIKGLIAALSSEDLATRESADRELSELGRLALPQLRKAGNDRDPEVARRVNQLVARIEKASARGMPAAAVRLLAIRKPEGATAALLSYLSLAEEEQLSEEVGKTLTALAERGGKPDETLVRALSDEQAPVRAAAAEALAQGGGKEGRAAVRKLLGDADLDVRLRAALALVGAGERREVPALIGLLVELPEELVGQAEDALHQLAGESAPEVGLGSTKEEKKKCREAWEGWWKANAARIDPARLNNRPWFGYTVICDIGTNRVYEIDRTGKERWGINGLQTPLDARVVGNRRVLIAEYNGNKVTERDFDGKVLWSKEGLGALVVNVQRLPNGNTFIATTAQMLEVDRTGKEVYTIPHGPGIAAAHRTRAGKIICINNGGQCIVMDTAGKQLQAFAVNPGGGVGSVDVMPNGHILIAEQNTGKVVEYSPEGKRVADANAPQPRTATALPNGHYLVASWQDQRTFEVDRSGKIVWEHKSTGRPFLARRR
jgi:HEAT repeat protein